MIHIRNQIIIEFNTTNTLIYITGDISWR
ncbi:hypothetical protein ACQ27_gp097 [Klebsiella phage K64-1]|nr:hypothetical protein ACQ27_gp097 [Klebsiella phage K64-1]